MLVFSFAWFACLDAETRKDSTGAVLGQVVHARCCVWCPWSDSAYNCGDSPFAVLGQGRSDFPVVVQRPIPMVRLFVGPKRFSCCCTRCSLSLLHRSCISSVVVLSTVHRQSGGSCCYAATGTCGDPTGAVLGSSLTCPLCLDRHVQCCLCTDRGDPTGAVLGYVIDMPVASVRAGVLHVPHWCGCLREISRQVPAVFADLWMVPLYSSSTEWWMLQRHVCTVPNCALLDWLLTCPLLHVKVGVITVVAQSLFPMVQ